MHPHLRRLPSTSAHLLRPEASYELPSPGTVQRHSPALLQRCRQVLKLHLGSGGRVVQQTLDLGHLPGRLSQLHLPQQGLLQGSVLLGAPGVAGVQRSQRGGGAQALQLQRGLRQEGVAVQDQCCVLWWWLQCVRMLLPCAVCCVLCAALC
jgi:hypothetical protein